MPKMTQIHAVTSKNGKNQAQSPLAHKMVNIT